MIYSYRNNHNMTVNSFNKYFAIWLSYVFWRKNVDGMVCVSVCFRANQVDVVRLGVHVD